MQRLSIHQGNVGQQGNVHPAVYPQGPIKLEQLDNPGGHFPQQGPLNQQGTNTNSQNETYNQQKPASQTINLDPWNGQSSGAELPKPVQTKEGLLKALNRSFDIVTILNQNDKLLNIAAALHDYGLTHPVEKDQTGKEAADDRRLEFKWIMDSLGANLNYLDARFRRDEANKEKGG
jgi:hypothetical protein